MMNSTSQFKQIHKSRWLGKEFHSEYDDLWASMHTIVSTHKVFQSSHSTLSLVIFYTISTRLHIQTIIPTFEWILLPDHNIYNTICSHAPSSLIWAYSFSCLKMNLADRRGCNFTTLLRASFNKLLSKFPWISNARTTLLTLLLRPVLLTVTEYRWVLLYSRSCCSVTGKGWEEVVWGNGAWRTSMLFSDSDSKPGRLGGASEAVSMKSCQNTSN